MEKCVRRGSPQRQSYWEQVVRRWEEGGQSVREYCRAEGLRESAFYFWRRKLARQGQQASAESKPQPQASPGTSLPRQRRPRRRSRPVSSPRRGPASFLPVQVMAPATGHDAPVGSRTARGYSANGGVPRGTRIAGWRVAGVVDVSGGVEIVLAQGRTVRVRSGFDRQTLADVLAVLEARPC
jgi:hypothetical protein